MKFSERYGYTLAKAVQLESMDDDLRNSLWNAINVCYWSNINDALVTLTLLDNPSDPNILWPLNTLWTDFFKKPLDMISARKDEKYREIQKLFLALDWDKVYDCIQFIAQNDPDKRRNTQFQRAVNAYLEQEVSGYRFVDGLVTPITDPIELDAIATAAAGKNAPVTKHLKTSVELLSDRQAPDYRNSIKESISAVESHVRITLGVDKGTLGDLLKHIDQKAPMHPALREAFSKLYGYTSDEGGIRHGLTENSREVTFEEAKFMLVACSAFINYVRGVTKS